MPEPTKIGAGRSVLLTFDDGPEPVTALDSILQTLATEGIVAEFYVIGIEVKSSPAKARAIVSRGHKISESLVEPHQPGSRPRRKCSRTGT